MLDDILKINQPIAYNVQITALPLPDSPQAQPNPLAQ